jgi:cytosine/adenosine deaminase-related metal-dependent hydrolase
VERLLKGRFASDEGLLTFGLAILGPGMSTYEVTLADLKLARELGLMASMHVTGRQLVPDGFRRLCLETDLIGPWANLVHANNLSDEYLALLVERGAGFTVTAEVEMQMGYGRPLTTRLRALGQAFSIGSDIESGMSADMFAVTRTTLQNARFVDGLDAIAATGIGPQAITITCAEALRWATMDGARMARLDHKVGSLTPGKQADVVVLRFPPPVSGPIHDPVAWIVLQGGRHAVDAVLIAGRFVKRDGRLLAADTEGIAARLARSGARIVDELRAAAPAH